MILNDFLDSRRSKRQNTNTIIAPPGTDLQLQSSSETSNDNNAPPGSNVQAESSSAIAISADGIQVGGIQIESSSETDTSSSAYPVPTTCATLKALIDDISQIETKRTTAKTTARAAITKQVDMKDAATEKLKAAEEKLQSLNEQLKGRNCFNIEKNMYGNQNYGPLGFIKTNEPGIWKIVFDQNIAITMEFTGDTTAVFSCTSSSSSSRQNDQSSTTVCTSLSEVPAGKYQVKVSSGDSSAPDYTPWVRAPLPITFTVGDKDYCQGVTCYPEGNMFFCEYKDETSETNNGGAVQVDSSSNTETSTNNNGAVQVDSSSSAETSTNNNGAVQVDSNSSAETSTNNNGAVQVSSSSNTETSETNNNGAVQSSNTETSETNNNGAAQVDSSSSAVTSTNNNGAVQVS